MNIFDDERAERSDELMTEANEAFAEGEVERARELYARAAELETELALDAPGDRPEIKGMLAESAVELWCNSTEVERTRDAIKSLLAAPDALPEPVYQRLTQIYATADRRAELVNREDEPYFDATTVELSLDGGRIRHGLAPVRELWERECALDAIMTRIVEWLRDVDYRDSGGPRNRITESLGVFLGPSQPGSYTINAFVAHKPVDDRQTDLANLESSQVVEKYFELGTAARRGPDSVEEKVEDADYARAFVDELETLAPDGEQVGTVETWSSDVESAPATTFTSEDRERFKEYVERRDSQPERTEISGRVVGADFDVDDSWLKLREDTDDITRVRVSNEQFEDDMWNADVRAVVKVDNGDYRATELELM